MSSLFMEFQIFNIVYLVFRIIILGFGFYALILLIKALKIYIKNNA